MSWVRFPSPAPVLAVTRYSRPEELFDLFVFLIAMVVGKIIKLIQVSIKCISRGRLHENSNASDYGNNRGLCDNASKPS